MSIQFYYAKNLRVKFESIEQEVHLALLGDNYFVKFRKLYVVQV